MDVAIFDGTRGPSRTSMATHTPPRAPLPASFGRGGDFGETAAALQQPQPPSTPLGEPRLSFPIARARVSPSPPREGDDGSLPSISVLIGRTASSDTDSAPPCRWPPGPAYQQIESASPARWRWTGPAQPRSGRAPFRSGPFHIFF
jgi:hypothetical protein